MRWIESKSDTMHDVINSFKVSDFCFFAVVFSRRPSL